MCGIVGVLGIESPEKGSDIVRSMCESIIHRGPDDHGQWSADNISFGMRRLSIIDLEGGHQPIWTEDGVGIVFNGEIYNYRSLRDELISIGYKFNTQSDTEVLLQLYHHFGLSSIEKLNGMFACCIIDLRSQEVHLIRDRMGIKPLYFMERHGALYFASEVRGILAGIAEKPKIDQKILSHHVTFGFAPGPETIWEGIQKLAPAQRLTYHLQRRNYTLSRYWVLNFVSSQNELHRNYAREFEGLFLAAVKKRIIASDVPVGVFLSGGLDSSSIAAAAIQVGHKKFHTFTYSNIDDERSREELMHARAVAEHIGSQHHELAVSMKEYAEMFEDTVNFMDEPHSAISAIPLRLLSRSARKYCKVVLSGEGADETLAGYDLHLLGRRADQRRKLCSWIPRSIFKLLSKIVSGDRSDTLEAMGRYGWSGFLRTEPQPQYMAYAFDRKLKTKLLREHIEGDESESRIQSWYDLCPSTEPLDMYLQVHCGSWLSENLLWRADKMSMAESLELRVPFLDHKLAEWAAVMPLVWRVGGKFTGYESKRVLREFARKYLSPSVDALPKRGITGPSINWLDSTQELGKLADKYLLTKGTAFDHFFDVSEVATLLKSLRSGHGISVRPVMHLLFLARWLYSNT